MYPNLSALRPWFAVASTGVLTKEQRQWSQRVWGQGWANDTGPLTKEIIEKRKQFAKKNSSQRPETVVPPPETLVPSMRGPFSSPRAPNAKKVKEDDDAASSNASGTFALLPDDVFWEIAERAISAEDPCATLTSLCQTNKLVHAWCKNNDEQLYNAMLSRLGWLKRQTFTANHQGIAEDGHSYENDYNAYQFVNVTAFSELGTMDRMGTANPAELFTRLCKARKTIALVGRVATEQVVPTVQSLLDDWWYHGPCERNHCLVAPTERQTAFYREWIASTYAGLVTGYRLRKAELREQGDSMETEESENNANAMGMYKDALPIFSELLQTINNSYRYSDTDHMLSLVFLNKVYGLFRALLTEFDDYRETLFVDGDDRDFRRLRRAMIAILTATPFGLRYQFVEGGVMQAEAGEPAGQYGWVRERPRRVKWGEHFAIAALEEQPSGSEEEESEEGE